MYKNHIDFLKKKGIDVILNDLGGIESCKYDGQEMRRPFDDDSAFEIFLPNDHSIYIDFKSDMFKSQDGVSIVSEYGDNIGIEYGVSSSNNPDNSVNGFRITDFNSDEFLSVMLDRKHPLDVDNLGTVVVSVGSGFLDGEGINDAEIVLGQSVTETVFRDANGNVSNIENDNIDECIQRIIKSLTEYLTTHPQKRINLNEPKLVDFLREAVTKLIQAKYDRADEIIKQLDAKIEGYQKVRERLQGRKLIV